MSETEFRGKYEATELNQIIVMPQKLIIVKISLDSVVIYDTYCIQVNPMIRSFKCKETEKIWNEERSRKFPSDIHDRALRKLNMLEVALSIEDLREPPSNHLEILKGNRKGQMSIRINNQWRICFVWKDDEATDIEIVDYH
jgi:proteic killer suppression protein